MLTGNLKWLVYLFVMSITIEKTNAQQTSPQLYQGTLIITDTLPREFRIDISAYMSICKPGTFDKFSAEGIFDTTGILPFQKISTRSLFYPVEEMDLSFSVTNTSTEEMILYLNYGLPDLCKLVCINDQTKQIITGGFLGNSNRVSAFSPNKYMPVRLPPNSTRQFLYYAKFIGSYKEQMIPILLSEKSYQLTSIREIDKARFQLIYHCFILGGILFISIFMFAQYFLNRDKTYLFYAAYGLFIFLFSEKIMELNCSINLISYFFPYYVFYSHIILQLLSGFFYIGFLKRLLGIAKKEKMLYSCCYIVQRLILAGCVLNLITFFIAEDTLFTTIVYNYGVLVSTVAMLPLLLLLLMKKEKDLPVKLVIIGFSIVVVATLLVVYINRSGLYEKFTLLPPISILEFAIFLEMIFFALALGYHTYKQKLEKETIELQKKETEMAALKAQMNPHFMFNCINSIDAFIQSNDKYNATLYLNKFAKLIRNVLDSSKQNVVSFAKDIATLKLYTELEELRSENKFTTQFIIDEELMNSDYKVPPLIIQPFVENAIIHGLRNKISNDGILTIAVTKNEDHLLYIITDNGIGRVAAKNISSNKEASYGLQMSYDRIRLFNKETNAAVTITDLYNNSEPAGTKIEIHLNIV